MRENMTKKLPSTDGLTDQGYETYANAVHDLEAKGGVCQLALKVYKLPAGQIEVAFAYQAPNAQELAGLRAALAEIIHQVRST